MLEWKINKLCALYQNIIKKHIAYWLFLIKEAFKEGRVPFNKKH